MSTTHTNDTVNETVQQHEMVQNGMKIYLDAITKIQADLEIVSVIAEAEEQLFKV